MSGADGDTHPAAPPSQALADGSLELFRERLAETVSWCQRRAEGGPPGSMLRSVSLVPPPALPWPDTLGGVAEQRRALLGRSWRRSLDPLAGGALLRYRPTPPHSGGDARIASDGYFDDRDTPPWDTWVSYVETGEESYLIAWVPPAALALATAGLKAAPGSLAWTTIDNR